MKKYKSENIKKIISGFSVREKLGQLLMLDFRYWGKNKKGEPTPFTAMNDPVANIIKKYNLGGIVFFRENTEKPKQIAKLTMDIQKAASTPLIIGIDQEGGIVTRLQTGTDMPGNMALGAINDTDLTREVAKTIGTELKALGINLNFAPDIDVNSNPANPIIGIRSFSSSPERVSNHGTAYIEGLKDAGIMSSAKHFPGHGNTASDTHLELATVNYSKEDLYDIDLKPFFSAIATGSDTIMAAHVIVPILDDTEVRSKKDGRKIGIPTTLSKKILTDLLRVKMKYDGLIITDAMDMKAISDNFGSNESTIMTILAGTDMPIMPVRIWEEKDIPKLDNLICSMEKEYETNPEFKNRVEDSLVRILELKKKFNLFLNSEEENKPQEVDVCNVLKTNNLIEKADSVVGCKKHKDLEKRVSSLAVTLLKNYKIPEGTEHILPFTLKNDSKILLVDANNLRMDIFREEFVNVCSELKLNAEIKKYKIEYDSVFEQKLKSEILNSDLVIVYTYNLKNIEPLPEEICKFTVDNKIKSVVTACRNPYDILQIPSCESYLAIYGAVGFDQTNYKLASLKINIQTSVRTIFNSVVKPDLFISPKGKLPVDISQDYPLDFGLGYTQEH